MTEVVLGGDAAGSIEGSLTSAALFAMTRYFESPSVELANLVVRHLECVGECTQDAQLADLCQGLVMRWRALGVVARTRAVSHVV